MDCRAVGQSNLPEAHRSAAFRLQNRAMATGSRCCHYVLESRTLLQEILRAEDGKCCRLQAWVIMPNHVHLVVDVWETPLSKLLNLWKGRSSYDANRLLR